MDNMEIYNAVREVPKEAQKQITAGRLKGKTDINPMWRIKALTERFGPCGIGWTYTIDRQWIEPGATGEASAFVNISLRVRINGEWSEPIPGTGGSAFIANERNGLYTSDECYKMALTDAISVACKALGFGADIYWAADKTKYTKPDPEPEPHTRKPPVCYDCGMTIIPAQKKDGSPWTPIDIANYSFKRFGRYLCPNCQRRAYQKEQEEKKPSETAASSNQQ